MCQRPWHGTGGDRQLSFGRRLRLQQRDIHSLGGGFSKASLKGQYVISQTGIGVVQPSAGNGVAPFSETIVFTADGNGDITVTVDDFDQVGGPFTLCHSSDRQLQHRSDGTGSLYFNSSNYAITMIDDSHFYIIEQDLFATASGFGEKQDTTAFTAAPSGTFVFKAHDLETSSRVGGITISCGAISGTEDLLSLGLLSIESPIATSVAMTAPDTQRSRHIYSDRRQFVQLLRCEFGQVLSHVEFHLRFARNRPGRSANRRSFLAGHSRCRQLVRIRKFGRYQRQRIGGHSLGRRLYDRRQRQYHRRRGGLRAGYDREFQSYGFGWHLFPGIKWPARSHEPHFGRWYHQPADFLDGQWNPRLFPGQQTAAVEDGTFSLQQGAPFTTLSNQAAFFMDGFDTAYKDRVGALQGYRYGSLQLEPGGKLFRPRTWAACAVDSPTNGTYQVSANGRVAVVVNNVTTTTVFYLSSANTGFMVQEDADIGGVFSQQASQ